MFFHLQMILLRPKSLFTHRWLLCTEPIVIMKYSSVQLLLQSAIYVVFAPTNLLLQSAIYVFFAPTNLLLQSAIYVVFAPTNTWKVKSVKLQSEIYLVCTIVDCFAHLIDHRYLLAVTRLKLKLIDARPFFYELSYGSTFCFRDITSGYKIQKFSSFRF